MLSFFSAARCAIAHPSVSWRTPCIRPPERIVEHAVHSPTRAYRGARRAFAHPSVSWSHVVLRPPERIGRTLCIRQPERIVAIADSSVSREP